ncbi:MAG: hypothetical protein ACLPHP_02910 [Candidatus Sulfotelmatobacter sp.]
MKFETGMRRALAFILGCSLATVGGAHAADKKDKPKAAANQTVDSGAFGVFVKGQRVASETFKIEQQNGVSIIKSELKEASGANPAWQKSELQLSASGELLRYEWSQSAGGSLSLFPENEFLKERITAPGQAKPAEQPFLLPATTPVLDNNFFIHREVLAWRYLAVAPCKSENGARQCQPADFGAVIPQDRTSMSVRLELVGKERITIHGAERELLRLNLSAEDLQWSLWVDENDHFKLIRVAIPADNTVVDRD